ncbi:MAG: rhodanese-related sulfurtransferase [Pseudomonadota bacterium]
MNAKKRQTAPESGFLVAALYHFAPLADFRALQQPIQDVCDSHGVKGTLLLAEEGINGTIAGRDDAITKILAFLKSVPQLADLGHKESRSARMPFHRMKVRLKREIVTMGVDGIDPSRNAGTYVDPQDWNELIADPDTIIIDTRNDYETAIGSFKGAVDPQTKSFREFPDWVRKQASLEPAQKIAMFCTGGIRCEKATAFMKAEGFENVFHLKGGILKYLEEVPEEQSLWNGACFVFDERVSVTYGLKQGEHVLCRACRRALTAQEMQDPAYEDGVSCRHCIDERNAGDRDRYRERHKQVGLAKRCGRHHIGG